MSARPGTRMAAAWPALPLLLFLALAYAWPILSLLAESFAEPNFGVGQYRLLLEHPVFGEVFARSFVLAGVVTFCTVALAYPLAWHLTLQSAARRRWLMMLILIPSWTSVLVRSFGWMILLGRHGMVNAVLLATGLVDRPRRLMFGTNAVALAMIAILLPYAVVPLYARMRAVDDSLLQAAQGLGAGGWAAFRTIHLPLCLPGLLAAASLVFVLGLGFFITPSLLGGPRDITVSMLILQQFQALLNWGFGAALSTVLLVAVGLALAVFGLLGRMASNDGGRA